VNKQESLPGHRSSMASKTVDEETDLDPDDHRALIELATTSYAILEREQRVDLKVKRRGPLDVEVRFRCLFFARSFHHLCMHML